MADLKHISTSNTNRFENFEYRNGQYSAIYSLWLEDVSSSVDNAKIFKNGKIELIQSESLHISDTRIWIESNINRMINLDKLDLLIKDYFLQKIKVPNTVRQKVNARDLVDIINSKFGVSLDLANDKDIQYVKNVLNHKVEVYNAGAELLLNFANELELTSSEYKQFAHNLIIHDLSKLGAKESFGYINFNFKDKTKNTQSITDAFDLAWKHHYSYNEHHPEFWMLLGKSGLDKILDIPKIYSLEMLADWIGAGKTYGSLLKDWLPNNLERFVFSEKTANLLNGLLLLLGFKAEIVNDSSYKYRLKLIPC